MSRTTVELPPIDSELATLVDALCEGAITPDDRDRLEAILAGDRNAKLYYVAYLDLHAQVQWLTRGEDKWPAGEAAPMACDSDAESARHGDGEQPGEPAITITPTSVCPSTPFVGGFVFSYMVATVFMCLLLFGFWVYKIPSDRGSSVTTNDNSREATIPGKSSHDRPAMIFVGRITGMAGVKWSADPDYFPPFSYASVSLGRKYKLDSGLLEITYDSGAKVILEGPCDFTAESTAGGYLALGKLAAKVDNGQWTVVSGQGSRSSSLATSHSPPATNHSPLSPLPPPLFSVRTPTAVVTDLGTEFGVEVDTTGDTLAQVFSGEVQVGMPDGGQVLLVSEGASARVSRAQSRMFIIEEKSSEPVLFTRRMPPPKPIMLFNDDFDEATEDGRVGKCFSDWTYTFGDGRASAIVGDPPGTASLCCIADYKSAAIVELSSMPEYNFNAFLKRPTKITFNIRSGSGGLRNPDGYPHRKWVGLREAGIGDPHPSKPMSSPGFYVALSLDGIHSAFNVAEERSAYLVFVDLHGEKTFLAGWDWTSYDGDGPLTATITLTEDSYRVEFSESGMKNMTGSLSGKLPSLGPAPAAAVVYCQGIVAPAGLSIENIRVERLPPIARQTDEIVGKEECRP